MLSSSTELREVFEFAPEWEALLRNWEGGSRPNSADFLGRVGAKAMFIKAQKLDKQRDAFVRVLRDHYYQPVLQKMLGSNQNLRRFLSQRYMSTEDQRGQSISLSVEISQKLESVLIKHLNGATEDGFKVLLPAYIQRTVHNSVIDYIRVEANWERTTLQDVYLDPEQDDPRSSVADDLSVTPENQILNGEQVGQLNVLRTHLMHMLQEPGAAHDALTVVDCMFGMGLTPSSVAGQEMTMREVCDRLNIQAETMARRIARCQVLLDKGLDLIRQRIYKQLPGIAECWQRGLNVNTASRRELSQQLGMTEGEIERLIKGRQFTTLDELVQQSIVKPNRLPELKNKGATAAFVPVEINSATARDITDILGLSKDLSQKLVSERPFKDFSELVKKGLIGQKDLDLLTRRGAVLKNKAADSKRIDLNRGSLEEITGAGIDSELAGYILKVRPFMTWSELEEAIGAECPAWNALRQRFYLGIAGS
ncbi:MAG: helix-hairpin-helix domain-containing protein [Candidatus Obscuribacterales bacterium]|nr:helix-hairpin-helix domain-containing protein [Candidatus Obscuribacterales bacterium]